MNALYEEPISKNELRLISLKRIKQQVRFELHYNRW